VGAGQLGHGQAWPQTGSSEDSSPHPSSPPPARAHDWRRMLSHGASLGIAICRRHLQATGPRVFSVVHSFAQVCSDRGVAGIVDISACFGDVQFLRWVHWAHAGQASLAMEPLPDASCHVCGRQLVFTARCGTEGRSYYIGLGACSVHFFLYCISLRPVTGLFSPGVTSICCGS
jgi:hypothetical protein